MNKFMSGLVFGAAILGMAHSAAAQDSFRGQVDRWALKPGRHGRRHLPGLVPGRHPDADELVRHHGRGERGLWRLRQLLLRQQVEGPQRAWRSPVHRHAAHRPFWTNSSGRPSLDGRRADYQRRIAAGFPGSNDSRTNTFVVFQPGGGVEVAVNPHLRLRAAVDLQFSQYFQARTTFGVVVPFGR